MADVQTANIPPNLRSRKELREQETTQIGHDLIQYLREYARENPESAALWCFGIGFILGWKLKPSPHSLNHRSS